MITMTLNKFQSTVTKLVVLVACLGVIAWKWNLSQGSRRPPTTSGWVEKLRFGDLDTRKDAIQELSTAGADDVTSVAPALIGALEDPDDSVRNEAVLALGRYLVAALKARGAAVSEQARAAATGLIEVIKEDGDGSTRASAAFAAASLLRALKDAGIKPDQSRADDPIDPRTMLRAFNAALARDPESRLALLAPYQSLGQIDEPAPPVLLAALDDPSSMVRSHALLALSQFTSGVDRSVLVLLKDAELKPREGLQVAKGAGQGSDLRRAAERLHPTAAVVPILAKGLESQDPDVRGVAVVLLGRVGPDARSAAPALIAATRAMIQSGGGEAGDDGPSFSDHAVALVQILPAEEATSILSQSLRPDHRATRNAAARALGKLGPRGQAAVPILLKALAEAADPAAGRVDDRYTAEIIGSLGQIALAASLPKPTADEVIEALSRSLDSPERLVRITAAEALGDFGSKATGALPRLRALSENKESPAAAREAASKAIEKIEPQKQPGNG